MYPLLLWLWWIFIVIYGFMLSRFIMNPCIIWLPWMCECQRWMLQKPGRGRLGNVWFIFYLSRSVLALLLTWLQSGHVVFRHLMPTALITNDPLTWSHPIDDPWWHFFHTPYNCNCPSVLDTVCIGYCSSCLSVVSHVFSFSQVFVFGSSSGCLDWSNSTNSLSNQVD